MLVYLHGGGWTLLDLDTHDRIMREYAGTSGWAVVGIDFPRSPETPFPRALKACVEVLDALNHLGADLGLSCRSFALAGDSSGANLALALSIKLREEGARPIDALVLSYGVYDCDLKRPSYAAFSDPPFVLSAERMAWFWANYDKADRRQLAEIGPEWRCKRIEPLSRIRTLRDENLAPAERLIEAGNSPSLDHYPRAPHGFLDCSRNQPEGDPPRGLLVDRHDYRRPSQKGCTCCERPDIHLHRRPRHGQGFDAGRSRVRLQSSIGGSKA
jgi:acetyl esterase